MEYYICLSLIIIAAVLSCLSGLPIIKILQLSGYKARGVFTWWKATHRDSLIRYVALATFTAIALAVFLGCFYSYAYVRYCAIIAYDILATVFVVTVFKLDWKKVKLTPRLKRLFVTDFIVTLIISAAIAYACYINVLFQSLIVVIAILPPFIVLLSSAMNTPLEKTINKKYIKSAENKLKAKQPIVIGITGSYGKTTAKNLLYAMLKDDFSTLATPESYNTPMGIVKTVNGEYDDQKIFIAEMGARYVGDIKQLCSIVQPNIGVITAVGDMHLETLNSRQTVANVKYELAKNLPSNGTLVLNGYNLPCGELKNRAVSCKRIVVGEEGVCYDGLKIGVDGTSFTLIINGNPYEVNTRLLGAHIAELSCLCAAVAIELGVSPQNIVKALNEIKPVKHRLELIVNGDIVVLDDAYNSNPVGASNAIDVLACFDCTKIIITPGFVELGAIEKQSNIELGEKIATKCDYAFLVGSRAVDIKKGAVSSGMAEDTIFCFNNRDEAVDALKNVNGKKVVLFENDLPDNIK